MATSDPITILLQHNRWAMRGLLETCAGLSHEQFHQRFEMGCGSLHDNLRHVLGAMRGWGDMLAGREQRARIETEGEKTPGELLALLDELADDIDASHAAHSDLSEVMTGERGGRTYSFTRGGVLTHVTTHGMHHRAQCSNMLRQLGVEAPPLAVVEWILMADG